VKSFSFQHYVRNDSHVLSRELVPCRPGPLVLFSCRLVRYALLARLRARVTSSILRAGKTGRALRRVGGMIRVPNKEGVEFPCEE